MSVDSRIFIGWTVELETKLKHEHYRKLDNFIETHEELDEYMYPDEKKLGKTLIIVDGMNGDFARLVKVDKFKDNSSLGDGHEFSELGHSFKIDDETLETFKTIYREYKGEELDPANVKYAIWNQWY